MLPVLTSCEEYETESVEVYHPVGNTDSVTRYPERTGSFEHILEEGVIPTQVRQEYDEELAVINEDVIRLAHELSPEGVEDYEQFIDRNEERLGELGREPTQEAVGDVDEGLEVLMDLGILPLDSGEAIADPVDINTITVYKNRQDAILQSEDKYGGVGGLCEINTPRECLTGLEERKDRAAIVGSVPIEFVERIYVASEDEEEPDIVEELENQSWDIEIESFPEDLAR